MKGTHEEDKCQITFLKEKDLKNKAPKQRARHFKPQKLMEHGLFIKHQPILFGGAALTLHYFDKLYEHGNRLIDDLDFFVVDFNAYKEFKEMREINFNNHQNHRIHFY